MKAKELRVNYLTGIFNARGRVSVTLSYEHIKKVI
jgi:hypothetical protein